MSTYIYKYLSLSARDSWNKGILQSINETKAQEPIHPDYKQLIPGSMLRRMSKVIRMGVGTAVTLMEKETCSGIIVGSGVGCYSNSLQFSNHYIKKREGVLSPTSFIQSTDNAIAGQIAIILQNNSYNNTYIHKGLAFENALIDSMLLNSEKKASVLVGGVDEWIREFKFEENEKMLDLGYWIGEGSSFFLIGSEKEKAIAELSLSWTINTKAEKIELRINDLLESHKLDKPDLVLYGNSYPNKLPLTGELLETKTINYSEISGIYYSNSAFALQMAAEIIENQNDYKEIKTVLIINNFFDADFGITYLSDVK